MQGELEVGCLSLVLVDSVSRQTHSVSDSCLSGRNDGVGRVIGHTLRLFVFSISIADLAQPTALLVLPVFSGSNSFACFTVVVVVSLPPP